LISQLTPSESSKIKQTAFEAFALKHLKTKFGNSIIKTSLYEDLLNRQMVVIQVQKSGSELKWMAMEELLKTKASGKFVVCVDADIDPGDLPSVMWAIVNRSQPHRDVKIVSNRPLPWNPTRFVADGEKYDRTDSSLLIDATLKADFPPVALPAKEFMERARIIWNELGLPELSPRAPWHGYSLGYWPDENIRQAENAVAGDYLANADVLRSKGIKVSRDDRFVDLKERYLSTQLASLRKK
jgi:4-hydroxy-3-polyprenylbenzoate decarboxylase